MVNAVRVGLSVLRYRGGTGQWAWAVHRVAGLGILAFLALHIFDIFLAAFGPGLFNDLLFLYKGAAARMGEILLAFGLLYHALNGLRITAADFYPKLAAIQTARQLYAVQMVVFVLLFAAASFMMVYTLPDAPFAANPVAAAIVTLIILALPALIVLAAQFSPPSFAPGGNVSAGNYDEAYQKILRGHGRAPRSRFEFYMWLFMRVSGVLLIVLVLLHFLIFHFVIGVEQIDFNTVVGRWNDPSNPLGNLFWRTYDILLLFFAFTHGINGTRSVLGDYVHSRGWRMLTMVGLAGLWVVLFLAGASVILFFNAKLS